MSVIVYIIRRFERGSILKEGNDMNILFYIFIALFFFIYPLSACLLFDRCNGHFHGFMVLNPIVLYSLLSWVTVNGFVYLNYLLDPQSFRGPEGAFALFFGWLYLWITSMPVFLLYPAVRMIFRRTKKENPNQPG